MGSYFSSEKKSIVVGGYTLRVGSTFYLDDGKTSVYMRVHYIKAEDNSFEASAQVNIPINGENLYCMPIVKFDKPDNNQHTNILRIVSHFKGYRMAKRALQAELNRTFNTHVLYENCRKICDDLQDRYNFKDGDLFSFNQKGCRYIASPLKTI